MIPIQTCIFDLGNVLVFFSHDRMVQNIVLASGVSEEAVREFLFDNSMQSAFETGKMTEEQFHFQFESFTGASVRIDQMRLAVGNIFELNAPMIPLLEELQSKGIRLVLLSNTCVTHIEFVRSRWTFLNLFDDITTSWEVGALKPDPLIYESALAQAKCDATNCFYTDDIEAYVTQAVSMGIQAHVFKDAVTTRETLRSLGVRLAPTAK
ncbi:MAG: HAD family phosphatase [Fuerstiella sp.]|nr:HAD family phosphatase [Fuerstiella sp.]